MPSLNDLFDTFLSAIEPDEETRATAIAEHEAVRKWLAGHESFGEIHIDTFLAGSYARRTSITPIKDVDVVVICSMEAYQSDPRPLLNRLHDALADNKRYKLKSTPRRRSIQIELPRVDLDVVPTVAPNGTNAPLRIPDRDVKCWFDTNPKGHIDWTQQLNAATKQHENDRGRFVPLVKMARWWRKEQLAARRHPKGHLIELCAGYNHDPKARDWADVFIAWLERSLNTFRPYYTAHALPPFPDPGLPGQTIKTGMEWADFEQFYQMLERSLPVAYRARELAVTDLAASARLWQQLFGVKFPPSDGGDGGGRGRSGGPTVLDRPDIREAPTFG